jgi:hypothetical protein
LLRNKRLLVIVDALSERTPAIENCVRSVGSTEINAVVLTTRRLPDFGPTRVTELRPEPVTAQNLVRFHADYLSRIGAESLFPGSEALELAKRLLKLVEARAKGSGSGVTPLLIRLFVDQAVELRRKNESFDRLPVSIPDIVVQYVRWTNPRDPQTPNVVADAVIVSAARILGWCSVEKVFVPRDFFRSRAVEALAMTGPLVLAAGSAAIGRGVRVQSFNGHLTRANI